MRQRLERLLCVKSLVTIALTVVFCRLAVTGAVSAQQFLTIFTVVISFYFGTQVERRSSGRLNTANPRPSEGDGRPGIRYRNERGENKKNKNEKMDQ